MQIDEEEEEEEEENPRIPWSGWSFKRRVALGDLTNTPEAGSGFENRDRRPNKLSDQKNADADAAAGADANCFSTDSSQNSEVDSKLLLEEGDGGDPMIAKVSSWSNGMASFGSGSIYRNLRLLEVCLFFIACLIFFSIRSM